MVTENGVWTAADRIRARPAPPGGTKERVSVRTVRRELGGGSFGDIARELRKWKDREDYRPAIERADLPEAFERRLTVIGRELLEMARVEAARAGLADFVGAEDRRAVARDLLDEALDRGDLLEERAPGFPAA
ncbi:MAG: DNA-binding protein, partial [Acidobacteria bacterium]|nr:DNA-binding protein [Acidobacteriota bacterium]